MHFSIKNFYKPRNAEEALDYFQNNPDKSVFLSGGTSLAKNNLSRFDTIIDVKSNFSKSIKASKDYFIISGSTNLQDILENNELNDNFDNFFKKYFGLIGNWQIRNMATIAGSIASRVGWSDVISLLLLLDTELEVVNKNGSEWIKFDEINKGLSKGDLITNIKIHKNKPNCGYKRFSRTEFDIALFNCGVALSLKENKIESVKVVFGSTPITGKRYRDIENEMINKDIYEVIEIIPELIDKHFDGKSSPFISKEYRKELAKVYMRRLLEELSGVKK